VKLHIEQLSEHLNKRLVPIYFVSGDEPLQLMEATDAIRRAAQSSGFVNRELFYVDTGFDWNTLYEASHSMPLFGERRILDLRLPSKPDKAAAAALLRYAERPAEEAILIVSAGKISSAEQKNRWFQALDRIGVVIQVWPLEGESFLKWLDRRLSSKGILAERSSIRLLAMRVEGNLLAAAQEIEKLHILYGAGKIDDLKVTQAVADSARYDVFGLAEAVLKGHPGKIHRILQGLRAEGGAPAVALWALTREIRSLNGILVMLARGTSMETAFSKYQVWNQRKPLIHQALQRLEQNQLQHALIQSARIDRMIKGLEMGDPWNELLSLCLELSNEAHGLSARNIARFGAGSPSTVRS
jgi:DNA polymerase-3 subunit delta